MPNQPFLDVLCRCCKPIDVWCEINMFSVSISKYIYVGYVLQLNCDWPKNITTINEICVIRISIYRKRKKQSNDFRYIKLYLDIFSCLCKFIAEHFLWKRGFMLGTNLRQSLQTFFRGGFKRFCVLNFICVLNDKTFPIRFILNYCCCFCKNLVFCVYICLFFPDNYTTS